MTGVERRGASELPLTPSASLSAEARPLWARKVIHAETLSPFWDSSSSRATHTWAQSQSTSSVATPGQHWTIINRPTINPSLLTNPTLRASALCVTFLSSTCTTLFPSLPTTSKTFRFPHSPEMQVESLVANERTRIHSLVPAEYTVGAYTH